LKKLRHLHQNRFEIKGKMNNFYFGKTAKIAKKLS